MGKYERILLPLDGSPVAETVLPEVETIAKAFKSTVTIIRAYWAHAFPGTDPSEAQIKASEEANNYVATIEKQLKAKGINVNSHTRYEADAAKAILDYCEEFKTDLIMMTTHGHSAVGRWLLGSVAEKIVHYACTPVLMIRGKQ